LSKLLRVIDAWDYLNDRAFGGAMTRPKIAVQEELISIHKKEKFPLHGAYDEKKHKIWLNHKSAGKLETLYHEMCHQYMHEVLEEEKFWQHGKVFALVYKKGIEKLQR